MVLAAYGRPGHLGQVLRIRPTGALILPARRVAAGTDPALTGVAISGFAVGSSVFIGFTG